MKTAKKRVSFTGGGRGGVDRFYKSGVKTYIQSTKTSDVVIGLYPRDADSFDLYFVPTVLIEQLSQKSISIGKIQSLKNNYDILEHCKEEAYVIAKCREFNILK